LGEYRKVLLGPTKDFILNFISSTEEDKYIVDEVIEVFATHVEALYKAGLINESLKNKTLEALTKSKKPLLEIMNKSNFEDIHEALEMYLKNVLGDTYGYLVIGRSRNDHVATALRLKCLKGIDKILELLKELRKEILLKACKYVNNIMPLYTHLQQAQLSSIAHYLLYMDEVIKVHTNLLKYIKDHVVSLSPLGSSAAAGTTVCIDRVFECDKLGFKGLCENTLYATSSRDFITLTLSVLTSLFAELTRFFNDLITWNMVEISTVKLPKEHVSTSSVMPHKKNPVTLEVLRALTSELMGYLIVTLGIVKSVGSGYSLDLQEVNKYLIKGIDSTIKGVKVLIDLVRGLEFDVDGWVRIVRSNYYLVLTDIAEITSVKCGVPYRSIYNVIAGIVRECGSSKECFLNKLCSKVKGLCTNYVELCKLIRNLIENPLNVLKLRCVIGSPNPNATLSTIKSRLREIGFSLTCDDVKGD